jgi:hypothetical protein
VLAQDAREQPAPAHISVVEGVAELERDGRTEAAPASMPVLAGDRVRTRGGRVEVLFADGTTMHLDGNTLVDFQSDDVIRLLDGRVRLNIPGPDRDVEYRIDAPSAWVQISRPGEYRVSVQGTRNGEVELAVLRGFAELVNEDGRTALRAGERAYASGNAAPSNVYVFNSAAWDEFDRWSESRRDQRMGVSAQYLPDDTRYYSATLDQYGSWYQEPTYGYVWYPRVAVGWRPYYHGRWSHLRPYGWTWIGSDPWAYATHHYGRWGFSARGWFWIPGRSWGPAWVSWAYAPGYVSWCPLGYYNKPVFSFGVNVFYGKRYDPWHAWTVVPHRSFGRGHVNVGLNVINVNRIDTRVRHSFAPRDRGPDYTHYAVPRGSAPLRASVGSPIVGPGARATRGSAQPRVGSPASIDRGGDASFRGRASTSGQLSGPGFPAPSRTPRTASPTIRSAPQSASPGAVGRGAAPSGAGTPGAVERRAVPRRSGVDNPASASSSASPERTRVSPRREVAPSPTPNSAPERGAVRAREVEIYRGTQIERANPGTQPDVYRGRAIERSSPVERFVPSERSVPSGRSNPGVRSMPQPEVHRGTAVPRSDPSSSPSSRPGSGNERRGPSDARPSSPPQGRPPSSVGPPSRSASPRGGSGGDAGRAGSAGRSRGGQPSSGRAVGRSRG